MKVLVVGAGLMGQATGASLRGHHEVRFFDVRRNVSEYETVTPGLAWADVVISCTATDMTKDDELDVSSLEGLAEAITRELEFTARPILWVQRSTTLPGTHRQLLNAQSARFRENVTLVHVPLFGYRKSATQDEMTPCKVVVGLRSRLPFTNEDTGLREAEEIQTKLWELFAPQKRAGSPFYWGTYEEAEMAKLFSNHAQVTLMGFWNDVFRQGQKLGADTRWVMETICLEKPLSSLYRIHGKGFGLDGRMYTDATATARWAERGGLPMDVIPAALQVNRDMVQAYGEERRPTSELKELDAKYRGPFSRRKEDSK